MMNSLERLRSIEGSFDVSISTFPHQVEMNRMRRRIALHNDVHSFFRDVGDVVDNFDELRNRYIQYVECWFELKSCIEDDIQDRIRAFQQTTNTLPMRAYPNMQNGIMHGLDANTANTVMITLRTIRPNYYSLRNPFVTTRLADNMFYTHACENLKQLIVDFIYCTIIFPKPGGLLYSFHLPHHTQINEEGFRPGQQIVLFEEEYEDRAPHVTPLVPFVHYGGSFDVLDSMEYNMALPFPMHELPQVLPLATDDDEQQRHITSILQDHDALFGLNITPIAEENNHAVINNITNELVQRAFDALNGGPGTTCPHYFSNQFRLFLARNNS
jgi:hypothetical protein